MIKALIIFFTVAVANIANADSISLTCCSDHYNGKEYNETNPGIVYAHSLESGNFVTIGGYKNSEGNNSILVGYGKRWKLSKDFDFSFTGGLVTGYQRGSIAPYAYPMVTYKRFLNVMGLPFNGGAIAVTFTVYTW